MSSTWPRTMHVDVDDTAVRCLAEQDAPLYLRTGGADRGRDTAAGLGWADCWVGVLTKPQACE
ncbi:hypothetical protein [Comamonas serinivorans]|uniref:hypothetical protein n=1 Tax=Comamonas serinivorans TaxID=1082851 RepID=UPI0012FCA2B6|nr:hypothetical protein [Comamonas serinivorans]